MRESIGVESGGQCHCSAAILFGLASRLQAFGLGLGCTFGFLRQCRVRSLGLGLLRFRPAFRAQGSYDGHSQRLNIEDTLAAMVLVIWGDSLLFCCKETQAPI